MTFETADDVLEHFGVKGMHWGVRKKSSSSMTNREKLARIQEIDRKINRISAERIYRGAGLSGHYNKRGRSNTPQRRATSRLAALGAVNVAVILGGGNIAVNRIGATPQARQGAQVGLVLLAGHAARVRANQIIDVHTYNRHKALLAERQELLGRR